MILSDQRMPEMSGVEVLRQARAIRPATTRLLFTAYSDIRTVIEAINEGHIFRYLAKGCDPDELGSAMRQAVEHHRLIVEKNRLLADLRESNERLEVANQLKEAFIEVASHELNTPLTVVLGMLELWKMSQSPATPPHERQWVDRIAAAAGRLARTVERMLKLVRNRDFAQALDREPIEIEPLARRAIEELSPYLELRRQTVTLEIEPGLGPFAADASKIADVLINLLANAVKFTPDGGTIRLEGARPSPRLPIGSVSRSAIRERVSQRPISNTSSSLSLPASTPCATLPATFSLASAASAWVSGSSRRSSSCTEVAWRSRARRGPARRLLL